MYFRSDGLILFQEDRIGEIQSNVTAHYMCFMYYFLNKNGGAILLPLHIFTQSYQVIHVLHLLILYSSIDFLIRLLL